MKKGLAMTGAVLLVLGLALVAYVRLSPIDTAKWHIPVQATTSEDLPGGAIRVMVGQREVFEALNAAAAALPRTQRLSGSVDDGRVTYVTRSLVFGFPDMTTIELSDGQIRMFARLRFGGSDMGVNRKRLKGLIATVQ